MELMVTAYKVAARLPPSERFGLTAQIGRAATSIPANVADGHASVTLVALADGNTR